MRIRGWSADVCSSELKIQVVSNKTRWRRGLRLDHGIAQRISLPRHDFQYGSQPIIVAIGLLATTLNRRIIKAFAFQDVSQQFLVFSHSRRYHRRIGRSEAHTSELQSLMPTSYTILCLKNKNTKT